MQKSNTVNQSLFNCLLAHLVEMQNHSEALYPITFVLSLDENHPFANQLYEFVESLSLDVLSKGDVAGYQWVPRNAHEQILSITACFYFKRSCVVKCKKFRLFITRLWKRVTQGAGYIVFYAYTDNKHAILLGNVGLSGDSIELYLILNLAYLSRDNGLININRNQKYHSLSLLDKNAVCSQQLNTIIVESFIKLNLTFSDVEVGRHFMPA